MDEHEKFMRKAISLSIQNIERGGGPFGAVIVKDGRIVATGVNRVTAVNDPTAPVFRTFFATPANYLIIKYNILFLGVAKKIICILENL